MKKSWHVERRTFLRGLGTAMALPALEAMQPSVSAAAAAANSGLPKRLAFVYMPNGAIMDSWHPEGRGGKDYNLSPTLKPLEKVKDQLQIITGLAHDKAEANGDGGGDHARANATFLTGCQARKTSGANIRAGVSVDQVAAQQIGNATRLPSLELSCDQVRKSGSCDSGYSCAYQFNLAWQNENTPVAPEVDPKLVFQRLFSDGLGDPVLSRRQSSVLDFVLDDAKRLHQRLGRADQQKLDEYLHSVRDLERRIARSGEAANILPGATAPEGKPDNYKDYLRIMFDLNLLAFKTDTTRISTFLMAHDGSNRSFREIGVPDGHHGLSHHREDKRKMDKIRKIDKFYVEQFAYFLERLKATQEGEGSLLDNCMVVYGSGHSDANRHDHDDLPVILAGGGGGSLTPGRHVWMPRRDKTPMTNLYLALLERMGVRAERHGDSTGILKDV